MTEKIHLHSTCTAFLYCYTHVNNWFYRTELLLLCNFYECIETGKMHATFIVGNALVHCYILSLWMIRLVFVFVGIPHLYAASTLLNQRVITSSMLSRSRPHCNASNKFHSLYHCKRTLQPPATTLSFSLLLLLRLMLLLNLFVKVDKKNHSSFRTHQFNCVPWKYINHAE